MKQWLNELTGWKTLKLVLLDRKIPKVGWLHVFGSVLLFLILMQALTGIFLAMNYSPSPDHAYDSVRYTMELPSGQFIRGLHSWGASATVAVAILHMLLAFFRGAYKYPRQVTWWTGVLLFLVIFGLSFTGYLLPWDQKAYWATVVGTSFPEQVPDIGQAIGNIVKGGSEIGALTLTRFYAFHVLLLPLIMLILLSSHLFLVMWHGISGLPKRWRGSYGSDWKDVVYRQHDEEKARGEPFYPYTVFKDTVAIAITFALLAVLAILIPPTLEFLADPIATYNPRPEWYLLFFYQFLKYFPGWMEPIVAIGVPAFIIAIFLLLPFIDRGPKRHYLDRPFIIGLGVIGILGVVFLSIQGHLSPFTNPIVEQNFQAVEGQRVYLAMRCQNCHSINGRGGTTALALDMVGSRKSKEWLAEHFRDPQKVSPGSGMPNFGLLDKEIEDLVVYMISLGGGSFTPEAPALFKEYCIDCHKIGDVGEDLFLESDLSRIGQHRKREWIARVIAHPESIKPDTDMPIFADILTPEQIEDLSRYLSAQRGAASKKSVEQ